MKSVVKNAFRDAADDRLYSAGDEYEADEARIARLEQGGFVSRAGADKPAPKRRTTRKAEAKE